VKALVIALLVALASPAWAAPHRVAIVVGNNAGAGPRAALRFAEADAEKLSQVLVDLGGFSAGDVHLLAGRRVSDVQRTFAEVRRRTAAWRQAEPGARIVLVFYFSGHSDGEALEVGGDRLLFGELRQWLAAAGADVRLAIVDSCKSGALLAIKGGTPGPTFDIRFTDDVSSSGEALLTSSAAHELALESSEVGGSFFSHHLISGLRGAADSSGDGRVTLSEAYRYAFVHTLAATTNTLVGPQHPVYDYRLSGQGELVLTELSRPSAVLVLPDAADRILVQDARHGQILAEVGAGSARRLAVPPGRYRLSARQAGRALAGSIDVGPGQERVVAAQELRPSELGILAGKGGEPLDAYAALFAGGVGAGVARNLGVTPSLRLGLRPTDGPGWRITAGAASARGVAYRESAFTLSAGYGLAASGTRLRAGAGLELGTGAVVQAIDGVDRVWTPLGSLTVAGEVGVRVAGQVWLVAELALPVVLLRRDDRLAPALLPSLALGLLVPCF
jgi:hypothetical protein